MGGPPAPRGSLRVGRTRRAATLVPDGWPPPPSGGTESGLQAGSRYPSFPVRRSEGQRGSVKMNRAPSPDRLSTHIRPP